MSQSPWWTHDTRLSHINRDNQLIHPQRCYWHNGGYECRGGALIIGGRSKKRHNTFPALGTPCGSIIIIADKKRQELRAFLSPSLGLFELRLPVSAGFRRREKNISIWWHGIGKVSVKAKRAAQVGGCSVCNGWRVCADGQAGGRLKEITPARKAVSSLRPLMTPTFMEAAGSWIVCEETNVGCCRCFIFRYVMIQVMLHDCDFIKWRFFISGCTC